jgi:hypothetical protein
MQVVNKKININKLIWDNSLESIVLNILSIESMMFKIIIISHDISRRDGDGFSTLYL